MKIDIKSDRQIQTMRTGGEKLSSILKQLVEFTHPGSTLASINLHAENLIREAEGKAGFKTVDDYQWATCINLNDGVVHGIPGNRQVQPGDIVSIDVGILYRGLHTDMSTSFRCGNSLNSQQDKKNDLFLQAGKEALNHAIDQIKPGRHIGHISQAMQEIIEEKYAFSCATTLIGHGIGRNLHEQPSVPCILTQPIEKTPVLRVGMTLAVEIIYMEGGADIVTDPKDHWTIYTKDGKMAAVFEKSIVVTPDGYLLLTP